jgi:hypothetical protein
VESSRALAVFYLEQAIALIAQLPSDLSSRSDIAGKNARFVSSLNALKAAPQ